MTIENQTDECCTQEAKSQTDSLLCNIPTWVYLVVCVLTIRLQMGG